MTPKLPLPETTMCPDKCNFFKGCFIYWLLVTLEALYILYNASLTIGRIMMMCCWFSICATPIKHLHRLNSNIFNTELNRNNVWWKDSFSAFIFEICSHKTKHNQHIKPRKRHKSLIGLFNNHLQSRAALKFNFILLNLNQKSVKYMVKKTHSGVSNW